MTEFPASVYPLNGKRVWIAGHRGMVGSALVRRLAPEDCEIVTVGREAVDLRRQQAVEDWMAATQPEVVIVAAATVGGILANDSHPANFLYDNLMIETNIIHTAYATGVEKLMFLGSSCIYPRAAPQPLTEDMLLTGPLESTNEWYAVAKIAGLKLCQAYRQQYDADFISVMPTNLYGPGDNFDLASSHVIPALLAKIHQAKTETADSVEVWGTGRPLREFLHVDDAANALVALLTRYSGHHPVNIGTGKDIAIGDLAQLIAEVVGFKGKLGFDPSKPDGIPRKLLDISVLRSLGWKPHISLRQGLETTYAWYHKHHAGDTRLPDTRRSYKIQDSDF